ncbi:hypothetical protein, partial [Gluconacetobacter entanii]|uniref:hypothetical protein n=1 Tax=Gluconacetobacter entanii TaxID=108528 RepID=UPI002235FE48
NSRTFCPRSGERGYRPLTKNRQSKNALFLKKQSPPECGSRLTADFDGHLFIVPLPAAPDEVV